MLQDKSIEGDIQTPEQMFKLLRVEHRSAMWLTPRRTERFSVKDVSLNVSFAERMCAARFPFIGSDAVGHSS